MMQNWCSFLVSAQGRIRTNDHRLRCEPALLQVEYATSNSAVNAYDIAAPNLDRLAGIDGCIDAEPRHPSCLPPLHESCVQEELGYDLSHGFAPCITT